MNQLKIVNQSYEFTCRDLNVEGFEYPTVINVIEDVSGIPGAVYIGSKYGRRLLSWQGVISTDVLENRRNLLAACQAGSLKTLLFETCDGLDLQTQAEVTKVVMPYKLGRTKYFIEAVAPDARFYSQELITTTIPQTGIRGGTSIPLLSIPFGIPQSIDTDVDLNEIVHNDGNVTTNPIITIDGPGEDFTVTNVTTGEMFVLSTTLADGESVVIDVANRTVIKDGITNVYEDFTGDFITLVPGENEMRFTVGDDIGDNTALRFSYRHAYIGI